MLLVNGHLLVRDDTVQPTVVVNPTQVAIMLNCNQRIVLECLRTKLIRSRSQRLGVKDCIISIKQLLNNIQHRRLTGSSIAIEHKKLLNIFCLASNNRANSPLNLSSLRRLVQSRYQFFPRIAWAIAQRVRKLLAGVVFSLSLGVGEYQLTIERLVMVWVPRYQSFVVSPRLRTIIAKSKNGNSVLSCLPQLFRVVIQLFINKPDNIKLISTPQSSRLIKYRIEVSTTNHEVLALGYQKARIDLDSTSFCRAPIDSKEVHKPSFLSLKYHFSPKNLK